MSPALTRISSKFHESRAKGWWESCSYPGPHSISSGICLGLICGEKLNKTVLEGLPEGKVVDRLENKRTRGKIFFLCILPGKWK